MDMTIFEYIEGYEVSCNIKHSNGLSEVISSGLIDEAKMVELAERAREMGNSITHVEWTKDTSYMTQEELLDFIF